MQRAFCCTFADGQRSKHFMPTHTMINRKLIRQKIVQLVYANLQNGGQPLPTAEKELAFSLGKAYDLYLFLLNLLAELQHYAGRRVEAAEARAARFGGISVSSTPDFRFTNNQFLLQLKGNQTLSHYRENQKQDWEDDPAFLKKLYTGCIGSDPYQLYLSMGDYSYEADREIIRKLYKMYLCENEEIDTILEENGLYWNDDKDVIDSFVLKTIKRFSPDTPPEQELLPPYDSEDDRAFATQLFRQALLRHDETQALVRDNIKNWDFNRLALMDIVIMQTALTEILTFPEIPISVSINEYLDIAKAYSTPRSAGYINGLLDHVIKQLTNNHTILKN